MLKVLHYIPGFLYGGIESMYLSWYRNINYEKVTFDLLLRTQDEQAPALKQYRALGGSYYRLAPISNIFSFKKSVELFFKEHHDYDILHAHEADPFVLRSAKEHGIPCVVIHSHSSNLAQGVKERLRFYDEKLTITLYADYAFACSELAAKWKFGGMRFHHHPVTLIHNAIPAELYDFTQGKRDAVRSALGLGEEYVIGHVGRMTYPKNQIYLLDIFNEVLSRQENSTLLMIGDGPNEAELRKYARDLGIEKKVRFLGARSDVPALLQGIDAFLLPSRYEGLPVTLIEAQASGLPCFISDVISPEAAITDLVYRLSIHDNASVWAVRMLEVNKTLHRTSTKNQIISNGYDIQSEVNKLVEKYYAIAEGQT